MRPAVATILSRLRSVSLAVGLSLLLIFALLSLVEGSAHLLLLAEQVWNAKDLAEHIHTEYDSLLGWKNTPHVSLKDFYGPDRDLTINAQGFRARHDLSPLVPDGMRRLFCVGDSFTLGFGVDDGDTWCAQLHALVPGLETVNMGQGGYGLDQAFLWYRRDAAAFEHQFVVVAFIARDFERMRYAELGGYGKPRLGLLGDSLVVEGVPVPRTSHERRGWIRYRNALKSAIYQLKVLGVADRLAAKIGNRRPQREAAPSATELEVGRLLMSELAATVSARGAKLTAVYLPRRGDYRSDQARAWKDLMRTESARGGWKFLDLTDELRSEDWETARTFFVGAEVPFPFAAGHYSARGNRWVAEKMLEHLEGWLPPGTSR
jgi:hypothetical protein